MATDVLRHGLRGTTENALDVVGGAVVAVLAMQTRHGRDVLRHMPRKPEAEQIGLQIVGRQVLPGDRPTQRLGVLPCQACDVELVGALLAWVGGPQGGP